MDFTKITCISEQCKNNSVVMNGAGGSFGGRVGYSCVKCPVCGCDKYVYKDELGTGYRVCASCTQEWWVDVDYDS